MPDLSEYGIEAPWLHLTQRGHLIDLACDACKQVDSFSVQMLNQGIMNVKLIRFHLLCGQVAAIQKAADLGITRTSYNLPKPKSEQPEVAKTNNTRLIDLE